MVRRRHRRSPFKKALIPLMLVMALIFSSVISMGFAEWQDKLTIETEVAVTGKPLTVELSKYEPYKGTINDLRGSTTDRNWVTHLSLQYTGAWFLKTYSVVAYSVPAEIDGKTITIYNSTLDTNTKFTGSSDTGILDGMGGLYRWYNAFTLSNVEIGFGSVSATKKALDDSDSSWKDFNAGSIGDIWGEGYTYQFHGANVPIKVTFTNPNPWEIKITSAEIISGSGEATVETLPLTVPAKSGNTDGTAYAVINPSNYQNFVMRFTDENGKTYDVTVNFENYDSTVGASAASAAAYSYRPSTTTTTTTTVAEETTTAGEETTTSASTTETSVGETETTTTTEATESTTSAETTTTTAPTSAVEVTTTASTTAATAAVTTVPTSAATSAQAETQPTESGAE